MDAEHIHTDDVRFKWDANFFGDVDFFKWGRTRASFLANYEVVLANLPRNFAPNQGNYILEPSLSSTVRAIEVTAVFHHESRHLADLFKVPPIEWNLVGGRIRVQRITGPWALDGQADLRGVIAKAYVDYTWEVEGRFNAHYAWRPRASLVSHITYHTLGVDGSRGRGAQTGVRAEGGVSVNGGAGTVEMFVAAERRVDPFPLFFSTSNWLTAGFRFLGR
jgi:hypothetical protein